MVGGPSGGGDAEAVGRTRRAGSFRSSSQRTAPMPLTIAAVDAVLASTQDPAVTDTVLQ